MSYTLWDANISEPYQFDQTPACHAEVVTITPPDASFTWLTANTGTSEIELNLAGTYDRSLIGIHTFTITKEVTYPDDYTQTTFTTIDVTETFDVEIIDPCLSTTVAAVTAEDMFTLVEGEADVQRISLVDTVSASFGFPACGQASLVITSVVPSKPELTTDYNQYLSVSV